MFLHECFENDSQDASIVARNHLRPAALAATVGELPRDGRPVTSRRVEDFPCRSFAPSLAPARAALETGRGFVILDGLAPGRYAAADLQAIYWLVGQLLGRPMTQNVE